MHRKDSVQAGQMYSLILVVAGRSCNLHVYGFSRRWSFNKCPFISFIRIILIDRAYYLKENLIGIFPVGVVFSFISFVKYI